ncbi:MAG TPA: vanadium-dependent haloperoxidase [Saprospiraceae bacterium]|nr:vanadium-dependent haloperoxidase [Saprospiraceae bacterium]
MRLFKGLSFQFAVLLCCSVLIALSSCRKDEPKTFASNSIKGTSTELLSSWMEFSLEATKNSPGYACPVSARAYAYFGIALNELAAYSQSSVPSFSLKLQGFDASSLPSLISSGEIDWNRAYNVLLFSMSKHFYRNLPPVVAQELTKTYEKNKGLYNAAATEDVILRTEQLASDLSKAIIAYSLTDGQDEAYLNNYPSSYTLPQGNGLWSPALTSDKKPLLPYWGQVRTFSSANNGKMVDNTPPAFSSEANSEMYAYALEVHNRTKSLTKADETMVRYWNDDQKFSITTPGHLVSILMQLIRSENKDLAFASQALMKLGIAMHDATVVAWKTKYTFNTVRPINYIRDFIDGNFITLVNTQASPEFSSAQAATAGAAAEVLGSIFGYSFGFTDRTYEFRKDIDGSPRSYRSFKQLAEEVTMSNLYGGIHYRFSLEAGQTQGQEIGYNISTL